MEFIRFDVGEVLGKERKVPAEEPAARVGNPLIMKEMVKVVADAASYAPSRS